MEIRRLLTRSLVPFVGAVLAPQTLAQFAPEEIDRIRRFWNEPKRYSVSPPEGASRDGVWQVRLTVAGSQWLWNYNKLRGIGKANPTITPPPLTPEQQEWERWIDAKVAWDRKQARDAADALNSSLLPGYVKPTSTSGSDPGPVPAGLLNLAGDPPEFAEVAVPIMHVVRFDDGTEIKYVDNVAMRPRYAYYRFEKGVQTFGKRVKDWPTKEIEALFSAAELGPSERRVMSAVSLLEGGFESVNTYDTGFVSVGLIQFASLKEGGGSLGRLLNRFKSSKPDAFEAAFRSFGIDATSDGKLIALDLETGAVVIGAEANRRIIEDRRLIAVFQHAGQASQPFRIAQLRSAFQDYYPADDVVEFQLGGKTLSFKVREFIRSEAGLATLMDRKVNTGTLDPLTFIVQLILTENGLATVEELQKYERDIVSAMKYRKDYLAEADLSQPGKAMKPERNFRNASRKATGRNGRTTTKGGLNGGSRGNP